MTHILCSFTSYSHLLLTHNVQRLVRAPTMHNGRRFGEGDSAVCAPGHAGLTTVVGGSLESKRLVERLLSKGGPISLVPPETHAPEVELHKAYVNLVSNMVGIIASIAEDGTFVPRTIGEFIHSPNNNLQHLLRVVSACVVRIGSSMNIQKYQIVSPSGALEQLRQTLEPFGKHTASSVQYVQMAIANKTLRPTITPTEAWLIHPMKHIANMASLSSVLADLDMLEKKLVDSLQRACRHYGLLAST